SGFDPHSSNLHRVQESCSGAAGRKHGAHRGLLFLETPNNRTQTLAERRTLRAPLHSRNIGNVLMLRFARTDDGVRRPAESQRSSHGCSVESGAIPVCPCPMPGEFALREITEVVFQNAAQMFGVDELSW